MYDLNEQVSFNAGLSYATRSPRLYEAMLAGGRRVIADNNLEAERARTLEAGVTYTPSQALRLAATVFHQNTRNHQDYQCINAAGTPCQGRQAASYYRLFNSGTLKNHGYELSAAYAFGHWTTRAGVAYSKPKLDGEVADSTSTAIPIGRTWTTGLAYQLENPTWKWAGAAASCRAPATSPARAAHPPRPNWFAAAATASTTCTPTGSPSAPTT